MLNASIVIYNTPQAEVSAIVDLLRQSPLVNDIYLIDNSPRPTPGYNSLPVIYLPQNKNLGYGRAHNIALKQSIDSDIPYHLVVNSDINFHPDTIANLHSYMDSNPDVGHAMPLVLNRDGTIQYLAKMLPSPFDLLQRWLLPYSLFSKRKAQFELRHLTFTEPVNVPYLSGCFMFLRTNALRKAGVFDPRYFMYPEDIDLTRRIHQHYQTQIVPQFRITHQHRKASFHSPRLMAVHIVNIIKYFNKWGWLFDKERKEINRKLLCDYQPTR